MTSICDEPGIDVSDLRVHALSAMSSSRCSTAAAFGGGAR